MIINGEEFQYDEKVKSFMKNVKRISEKMSKEIFNSKLETTMQEFIQMRLYIDLKTPDGDYAKFLEALAIAVQLDKEHQDTSTSSDSDCSGNAS